MAEKRFNVRVQVTLEKDYYDLPESELNEIELIADTRKDGSRVHTLVDVDESY